MKGFVLTWEPVRLRMIRLQRSESGPYVRALTVHIPDMRVEIVKICPHSSVFIEPVFRYRTPKFDRLIDDQSLSK